jgi:diguanylate cyclase (GGDEF)-like protein
MSGPVQFPPAGHPGPADHDAAADEREGVADQRDDTADERDAVADERDDAGDLRDDAADVRDLASGRRDAAAVHRDRVADRRDAAAARREREADARERHASAPSAVARSTAADRRAAALDRQRASRDREAGAGEREQAEVDRRTARTDRSAGAVDRRSAGEDRGASSRDREDASLDSLTGAYGRGAGLLELEREVVRAQRTNTLLTVAFLDVDNLKVVNDSGGHASGDRLLIRVATALRHRLRSYDLVIRYGGDEFVCVLPDVRTTEADERFALVNADLAPHGSVTVGVVTADPGEGWQTVVARADAAFYAVRVARSSGGRRAHPSHADPSGGPARTAGGPPAS